MQEKMPCFLPQKGSLTNQIHMKNEQNPLWSTKQEQLNIWAPPHNLMPKYANHIRLVTLHLEYWNCPMFLSKYMQRIL